MKKLLLCVVLVPGMIAARAQFFKKMVDNVKQTMQNRANGKANQATNKALDKVDSATRVGGGTGAGGGVGGGGVGGGTGGAGGLGGGGLFDTSSTNRVLSAFAKAAAQNPNDTSAADVTMKALGILAGGGGVSAADSAKAIAAYRTATGGPGVMYMMVTTMTGKMNRKDTSRAWFTNSGEGRSEMTILGSGKLVLIGRLSGPTYSITLDDAEKTYSLNVIDTSLINSVATYSVEKLGTETVMGYPCTHVRIKSTAGKGKFSSSTVSELWLSTAVPGYSILKNGMLDKGAQIGMLRALHQAGVDGFFVKMTAGDGKDYSMVMQLVSMKEGSFPAAMFVIPGGYKESDEGMIPHLVTGAAAKKKP